MEGKIDHQLYGMCGRRYETNRHSKLPVVTRLMKILLLLVLSVTLLLMYRISLQYFQV